MMRRFRIGTSPVSDGMPVMKELAPNARRTTRIHQRGSFLDPGDQVAATLPPQLSMQTRRHFLGRSGVGLGAIALAALHGSKRSQGSESDRMDKPMAPKSPPLPSRAKRVIYLHMAGSPSQLELFDYKPELHKYSGMDCPKEYLEGKRFAFIQGVPKMLGPMFPFRQHGQSGNRSTRHFRSNANKSTGPWPH
jgi:hypothetical protein